MDKWSKTEKKISRKAFEKAYERCCEEIIEEIRNFTSSSPEEIWKLCDRLNRRRKEVDNH